MNFLFRFLDFLKKIQFQSIYIHSFIYILMYILLMMYITMMYITFDVYYNEYIISIAFT